MTLDEAKKWVDRARGIAPEFRNATESALIALDDALRAAEAQVAAVADPQVQEILTGHLRGRFLDSDAGNYGIRSRGTRTALACLTGAPLPVPPARTSEPAAPTMVTKPLDVSHWPAPTGTKWTATATYPEPGVTMGPGEPAAPTPGPTPFDAEAALVAGREAYARADSPLPIDYLFEVMLDAGRRGTR